MNRYFSPLQRRFILSRSAKDSRSTAVWVNLFQSIKANLLIALVIVLSVPFASAQDFEPVPLSEYAEKSGPNTITFLSYPKYYTTAEGELTPVVTNLAESKRPDWDFEVTTGIWTLRVRTDGTFQAEHQGNVFTYRLAQIGVGRGEGFRAFEWGDPNWKNYQVVGDSIRWYGIFRDVDLRVRYIHDILKVDVIVKAALLNDIRAGVRSGKLNADEYLTARFYIPNIWVTGEARQGGEPCDLYAERLKVQQPVEFVKEGKVVQKLRPVEMHMLDEKGKPIVTFDEKGTIRSAQSWRLKKDAPGVAEMSANLGDLAKAKDGDVAIDPGISFDAGNPCKDACISNIFQTNNSGSDSSVSWGIGYLSGILYDHRLLFGFNISSFSTYYNSNIHSASLEFYALNQYASSPNAKARAYKLKQDWIESTVTWQYPWSSNYGGFFENLKYQGRTLTLPTSGGNWIRLDVTQTMKSHLIDNGLTNMSNRGFIIKGDTSTTGAYTIAMKEYTGETLRPRLTIAYGGTKFGAQVGNGVTDATPDHICAKLFQLKSDKLLIKRYSAEEYPIIRSINVVNAAINVKNMAVIPIYVGYRTPEMPDWIKWWTTYFDNGYVNSPTGYANYIEYRLNYINTQVPNSVGKVIRVIEIGSEEESGWDDHDGNALDITVGDPTYWFGSDTDGECFADFYLSARNRVKEDFPTIEIISGGSPEKHEYLIASSTNSYGSTGEFIRGFIDRVIDTAGYDNLPETIGIHGYTGHYPPEFFHLSGYNRDWSLRLHELYDICNYYGYIPNFSITEYGFSPVTGSTYGPLNNGSDEQQSIYYLRSSLMNASMQVGKGVGWKDSMYHQHYFDDTTSMYFYTKDAYNNIVDRQIRFMARELFGSSIGIGLDSTCVWVPLKTTGNYNSSHKTAWCGWYNVSNIRWAAVWIYPPNSENYVTYTPVQKSFEVEGNYASNYSTSLWRFDFSGTPQFTQISGYYPTLSYNTGTGKTTVTIPYNPGPGVSHNPIFVKFIAQ